MTRWGDDTESPLAGADRRVLARVYGGLAFQLPVLAGTAGAMATSSQHAWRLGWIIAIVLSGAWGLVSLWLLYTRGQTLGKALAGVRMVRSDGSRASLARLLFRRELPIAVLNALPFGALVVLLESSPVFGARRRCTHDWIADTIVVDLRHAASVDPNEPSAF
ncbi:MAG: RDD family protein [Deltaproteobacteria bacterium]|nr:RDD family protein [Deltaproteobacteria bacterium]